MTEPPPIAHDEHPLLRFAAFESELPAALGEMQSPLWLAGLLAIAAEAPLRRDEGARQAIRDLLRHGGYKPTGRGKPSSEYLVRESEQGALPSINLAVDACNAVSLHSGLPISVVDLHRARPPHRIGLAGPGAKYVFNASGHEIDLEGLLCLFDGEGPCANAVKDSQRTKTHPGTRKTLSVVWGAKGHEERLERAVTWYQEVLGKAGVATRPSAGPR
jgi:DNA/RNA-binding domain of Phe-tRNA-synthetase-like protein